MTCSVRVIAVLAAGEPALTLACDEHGQLANAVTDADPDRLNVLAVAHFVSQGLPALHETRPGREDPYDLADQITHYAEPRIRQIPDRQARPLADGADYPRPAASPRAPLAPLLAVSMPASVACRSHRHRRCHGVICVCPCHSDRRY